MLCKFDCNLMPHISISSSPVVCRHPHHLRARLPHEPEELSAGPYSAQGLSASGHRQELPAHVHCPVGATETGDDGQGCGQGRR